MLQGSVDGDPAAPAGFAEALSERAQKSTPRGAFFMPGIWCELKYQQHHKPTAGGGLPPIAMGQLEITWLTHRHREQAPSHIVNCARPGVTAGFGRGSDDPLYRPGSDRLDHDPCAPNLPCHLRCNARHSLRPCR